MSNISYFYRNPLSDIESNMAIRGFAGGFDVSRIVPQGSGLRLAIPELIIPEGICLKPLSELSHNEYVDPSRVDGDFDQEVADFERFNKRPFCHSTRFWGYYPFSISVLYDQNYRIVEDNTDQRYAGHPLGLSGAKAYLLSLELLSRRDRYFPTYLAIDDVRNGSYHRVTHVARYKDNGEMPDKVYTPSIDEAQLLLQTHLAPWVEANPAVQNPEVHITPPDNLDPKSFGYLINEYRLYYLEN